jgi:hypothetical protein
MAYEKLQAYRAVTVTPGTGIISTPSEVAGGSGKNNGCVLYVGTTGNIDVETVGGDLVTFSNINSGSFIPVQVLRVFATSTASDIIALW